MIFNGTKIWSSEHKSANTNRKTAVYRKTKSRTVLRVLNIVYWVFQTVALCWFSTSLVGFWICTSTRGHGAQVCTITSSHTCFQCTAAQAGLMPRETSPSFFNFLCVCVCVWCRVGIVCNQIKIKTELGVDAVTLSDVTEHSTFAFLFH